MSIEAVREVTAKLSATPYFMRLAIAEPGQLTSVIPELTPKEKLALGFSLHGMNVQLDSRRQPEILTARLRVLLPQL